MHFENEIITETLQTQIEGLRATTTAQSTQIERLQAVLVAFGEPDASAIDHQLLSQLCARPYDSAAINQLLSSTAAVPRQQAGGSSGPSVADEFELFLACSVMPPSELLSSGTNGTEQPPVQPASSFQHQDVAESAPVDSQQEIHQIAERVVGRKSRKRSNPSESELHKKNETEKKRIKQLADIIARLREELALHVDAHACDPHSVSRN